MEKKNYIQPETSSLPVLPDMSVMLLNSNLAIEPGKQSAPKLAPMVNNADTTAVF